MDEMIDILDASGTYTGETTLKSEAHRQGLFHPTVHIWFYRADGMVLIQQRGKDKDTYPLRWDVSVAGHVGAGEAVPAAAVREVREEIGLDIRKSELEEIGVFKAVHKHRSDLIDCEFHHTFICQLQVSFTALKKLESEVKALKMISLLQLAEETWGLAQPQKYVPHPASYYKTVVKAIKARL